MCCAGLNHVELLDFDEDGASDCSFCPLDHFVEALVRDLELRILARGKGSECFDCPWRTVGARI